MTLACATRAEERAARASGLRTALIGLAGHNGIPGEGELVSFGLAGALRGDLACGDLIDAVRVVDTAGATLWEGAPLGVPGARRGTILAAERIVDDPADRARLGDATGADVADLESGPLARTGRLAGCLRVVSDTPSRPLGRLREAVTAEGRVHWPRFLAALVREPLATIRAASDARCALEALARTGKAIA